MAGHSPTTLFAPGSWTEVSNRPPVKQNLFHVERRPPWKLSPWVCCSESVMRREPLDVVIAAGSYHSRLFVCGRMLWSITAGYKG